MPYLFAGYCYDAESGLQFNQQRVELPPKERALLAFLLRAGGRIVSKDAVVSDLWSGGVVSDESIARVVYRLRRAMQAAGGPPVVSTVYNGGFRLSAAVQWTVDGPEVGGAVGEPSAVTLPLPRGTDGVLLRNLIDASYGFSARDTLNDLRQALRVAQTATVRMPNDADSWAVLAEQHVQQALRGIGSPRLAGERALAAATQAISLRSSCASAWAIRGWVRGMIQRDLSAGLADQDVALRNDPDCWRVCFLHAHVLQAAGAHEQAIAMAKQVQRLNPECVCSADVLTWQLIFGGQLQPALACAQAMVVQFPSVAAAHVALAIAWGLMGDLCASMQVVEQALGQGLNTPGLQGQRAYLMARKGRVAQAERSLSLMDIPGAEPAYAAHIVTRFALGQSDAAVACWLQAKAAGAPQYADICADPRLDTVTHRAKWGWIVQT